LINPAAILFKQNLGKMIFFFKKIAIKSDLPEAKLTPGFMRSALREKLNRR
jgi:hypothetical protein